MQLWWLLLIVKPLRLSHFLDDADAKADSPLMEAGMDSPDPRLEAFSAACSFHTLDMKCMFDEVCRPSSSSRRQHPYLSVPISTSNARTTLAFSTNASGCQQYS